MRYMCWSCFPTWSSYLVVPLTFIYVITPYMRLIWLLFIQFNTPVCTVFSVCFWWFIPPLIKLLAIWITVIVFAILEPVDPDDMINSVVKGAFFFGSVILVTDIISFILEYSTTTDLWTCVLFGVGSIYIMVKKHQTLSETFDW